MTIPTYLIESRDGEAEHEFVEHFGRMFKNLVRQYMPEYPTTEQQHDLLAQMQDRTSCFAPYVWSGPKSDMPQGEPMEVTGPVTGIQRQHRDPLLRAALYALEYHQAQTRPIDLTTATINAIRAHFNEVPRT